MTKSGYFSRMKLPVFLAFLLVWSADSWAQAPIKVPVTLQSVTVYRSSAQLRQTAKRALPAGTSEVHLTGVAASIVAAGLQIEVEGAKLVSSSLVRVPPKINASDSLKIAEKKLYRLQAEREALVQEKDFLLNNKSMPASEKEVWTAELQKGADYFRKRMFELTLKLGELDRATHEQDALVKNFGLHDLAEAPERLEIVVRLTAANASEVEFNVSYNVPGSWWTPRHDVRLNEPGQPIEVINRAVVHNETGLDWKDVQVSLLTVNPNQGALRPALQPWTLRYSGEAMNEGLLDNVATRAPAAAPGSGSTKSRAQASPVSDDEDSDTPDDFADRFGVASKVSIPSGTSQVVQLGSAEAPATIEYLTVPKLDPGVFLLAKVTGWEKLKLMADSANVYLRGAYLGTTFLNTRAFGDTLELALGRDPLVRVNRTKRQDFNKKGGLGRRTVKLDYEIVVTNLHKTAINMRVLDQIPVPQEEDITVTYDAAKGAVLDKDSGRLTWEFSLAPNDSRKLPFSFEIEYPKNKNVNLNRNRRTSSPKFR
jgi:uncharacterized protein (TIGR02231 family)